MKIKKSNKAKIILSSLGAVALLTPIIAVSAVACSSENLKTITIKTQPENKEAIIGQTEDLPTFSVTAEPIQGAQLKYQWYSNTTASIEGAKLLTGSTSGSYTIPVEDTKAIGTKYYYVEISNAENNNQLKSITSKIVNLTIVKVPEISVSTQPTSQTAIIGQTENLPIFSVGYSISTKILGNTIINYQWYVSDTNSTTNGNPIMGANSSSYKVSKTNVSSEGQKYFYVGISGSINGVKLISVYSNVVSLTVSAVPKIIIEAQPATTQNAIVSQIKNLPMLLSVSTNNIEGVQMTYQWYSSTNTSTTNGTVIDGATNSTYIIPESDLTTATTKYYYVKISGSINGILLEPIESNVSTLIIKEKPTISITAQPANQTVYENQTANLPTFSVTATTNDSNEELLYQWYSNNENSTNGGTKIEGATSSSYKITQEDIGSVGTKYFYVQINGLINGALLAPISSTPASLTTQAASTITISTQPTAEQIVAKDASVSLSVTATSTATANTLNYQWQKSNNNTADATWTNISGANAATYTFNENNDYSTITYFRVIITQEGTSATTTSTTAKVTVGYTNAQAQAQMNAWLANPVNQESLLNAFFKRAEEGPLGIFKSSSIYGYRFDTLPKSNTYTLSLVKKTETNKLPFDAWNVRAVINAAGTISKWNESTSKYDSPETIPVNSVISFYLSFNFTKAETITAGTESITMTPTLTLNNNSSQLQITRSDPSKHIPYAFNANPLFKVSITKFLLNPSTPIVIIASNYQWPNLPTITSTNSNLPSYIITPNN